MNHYKSRIASLFIGSCFIVLGLVFASIGGRVAAFEVVEGEKRPLSPTSFHDWQRRSDPQDFDINACVWAFSNETRLLTADLNGDGRTDLVCFYYQSNGSLTMYIQLADGHGDFQQWQEWGGGDSLFDCELFRLADIDGDDDNDVVCIDRERKVLIKLSDAGQFSPIWMEIRQDSPNTFRWEYCYNDIQIVDANQDGTDDLICTYLYPTNNSATFALPLNGYTQASWVQLSDTAVSSQFRVDYCHTLRTGDVDGNGQVDLICLYLYPDGHSAIFVQLANDFTFGNWQIWSESTAANSFNPIYCFVDGNFAQAILTIDTGDVDGDGLTDLICPYYYPNVSDGSKAVLVHTDSSDAPGQKYGHWTTWQEIPAAFNVRRCSQADLGASFAHDLNGDGRSDLVCVYVYATGNTATFVSLSEGDSFSGWERWSEIVDSSAFFALQCAIIQVGDVDGDGLTDLICPYVEPNGSVATYVQQVAFHQVHLPILVK
ncbi:MAG: VCBS repeat-containing protein [Chloroflexota bacterium]